MEVMTRMKALQTFFSQEGGRPLSMQEMKSLPSTVKAELGALCAAALGVTLTVEAAAA